MKIKVKDIFQKVRIATALGRVVFGGKVGKILDKTDQGIEIAEAVKELVKSESLADGKAAAKPQ